MTNPNLPALPDKQTSTEPSGRLKACLVSGGHSEAITALAEHLDEVRAVLPALERQAAGCGDAFVIKTLARLLAVFPVGEKAEGEWREFWAIYTAALSDLPAEALTKAVEDWTRKPDAAFFPKPGPLRALADEHAIPARSALYRAKQAIRNAEKPKRESVGRIPVPPEVLSAPSWAEKSSRLGGYTPPRPTETPQEMAERIRRHAEAM